MCTDDRLAINERLFDLMRKNGIKKAELARRTGIKSNTISDWETKGTNPQASKIARICEVLNVSTDYLLTGVMQNEKLSIDEKYVIDKMRLLPTIKRGELIGYLNCLCENLVSDEEIKKQA